MKILCIGKPTDAIRMLPPEVQLNLFESFAKALEQQREERKILELYSTPIGYTVAVLNYDSAEKWVEDQKDMPMLNYMEYEIYPLADGFAQLKRIIESLKKAVGQ